MSDIMNNVNLCHLSYGTDQDRDRGPVGEMLPQKAERLEAALSMASSYEPVPLLHTSSLLPGNCWSAKLEELPCHVVQLSPW